MLFIQSTSADLDSDARGFEEFFNASHSVEAIIQGVKLAVWCSSRPLSWRVEATGGAVAWFGWLDSGHVDRMAVPIDYLEEHPEVLRTLRYVALATPDLQERTPRVWRALEAGGYRPKLSRQITGWYLDNPEVTTQKPSHRPSLALLPERSDRPWHSVRCLVLVEVNYMWLVLSERGASQYTHGSRLVHGETIDFLPESGSAPVELELATRRVQPEQLEAEFGPGLLDADADALGITRARPDAAALVVHVK